MSLSEFGAIMDAAKLLGEKQTSVIFATSQYRKARPGDGDGGGDGGDDGGATAATAGTGRASTVDFQASFVSHGPGASAPTELFTVTEEDEEDDQAQLDFPEFLEALVRVAIWKFHGKPAEGEADGAELSALVERVLRAVAQLEHRQQTDEEKNATRMKTLLRMKAQKESAANASMAKDKKRTGPGISVKQVRRTAYYF